MLPCEASQKLNLELLEPSFDTLIHILPFSYRAVVTAYFYKNTGTSFLGKDMPVFSVKAPIRLILSPSKPLLAPGKVSDTDNRVYG